MVAGIRPQSVSFHGQPAEAAAAEMTQEKLDKLLEQVDAGLAHWLKSGITRWQHGEPLDRALELTGPRAEIRRNAALRLAAERLDPKAQLSAWARAQKLAKRLDRFERISWPRCKNNPDHTYHEQSVEYALLKAFRTNTPIPKSARRIWDLIR